MVVNSLLFMFYMLSPFVNPSLFSNPAAPKCLIRCLFGFCCLLWGNEIQAADEYLHLGYFKGLVLCGSSGLSPCPVFWFGFNWWEQALWVLEIWKQGAHPVADRITGVWESGFQTLSSCMGKKWMQWIEKHFWARGGYHCCSLACTHCY